MTDQRCQLYRAVSEYWRRACTGQMSYFYTKWEYKWSNSFFAASLCDFKAMSDALILKDNEQMAVAAFMWCSVQVSPDSFELGRKGW